MKNKREWHYKGDIYCRPIFTYEEIKNLLDSLNEAIDNGLEINKKVYIKILHYKNKMDENIMMKECE